MDKRSLLHKLERVRILMPGFVGVCALRIRITEFLVHPGDCQVVCIILDEQIQRLRVGLNGADRIVAAKRLVCSHGQVGDRATNQLLPRDPCWIETYRALLVGLFGRGKSCSYFDRMRKQTGRPGSERLFVVVS